MERQLGNPFSTTAPKGTNGQIRGIEGQIKWHYYIAAQVEKFAVARTDDGHWTLGGIVVISDAFKMSQRPLMFVAPHQKGEWQWPIESLELSEYGRLSARLGPPLGITL